MADINPDDIPFVPSTDVSLIDPESGRPKAAFHDWMSSIFDWMKRSVVDLTTKITTLTDTTDDLAAELVVEQTARIDGDTALAGQITTVDTKVGNISASGAVYLAAKAAPSGATAAYGWYLTAGSAFAGMEAVALSGGGSAIGFTANQFYFTDSGTAQQVFSYSGGSFVFNVPVIIRSGTSGERTEITPQNIKIYDSGSVLRVALGVSI